MTPNGYSRLLDYIRGTLLTLVALAAVLAGVWKFATEPILKELDRLKSKVENAELVRREEQGTDELRWMLLSEAFLAHEGSDRREELFRQIRTLRPEGPFRR